MLYINHGPEVNSTNILPPRPRSEEVCGKILTRAKRGQLSYRKLPTTEVEASILVLFTSGAWFI